MIKEIVWFIRYVEATSDVVREGCIDKIARLHGFSYAEAESYVMIVVGRARSL